MRSTGKWSDGIAMMLTRTKRDEKPFGLVLTGQSEEWLGALEKVVGSQWLTAYPAESENELLGTVEDGIADAVVLDETDMNVDSLKMLKMIRRMDRVIPVVVVTVHRERRWLEDALRLSAFSVVARPLELEELLRQIQRIMIRFDYLLRNQT